MPVTARSRLARLRKKTWGKDPTAVVALIIATAALGLSGLQYLAQERASRTTLRAWVTVGFPRFDGLYVPGAKPSVVTPFTNSGASPAVGVITTCQIRRTDQIGELSWDDLEKHYKQISDTPATMGVLGQQQQQACTVHSSFETAGEPERQNILARKVVWLAYGVVDYMDIFGSKHQTRYCFVIDEKHPDDARRCDIYNTMN